MPAAVRVRLRRRGHIRRKAVTALANAILSAVGEPNAELCVELIGDRGMQRLNREYRGRNTSTDVLAFSQREAEGGPRSVLLGDVVISVHTAVRQARVRHHSADEELAVLLIHGILHLCGYDHERSESEARRMRRRELIVRRLVHPLPRLIGSC
ncbi:MAG: rRNA maturation RNase YbeY [Nitrospiraceae bacterium]